jgi:hypothetical protein
MCCHLYFGKLSFSTNSKRQEWQHFKDQTFKNLNLKTQSFNSLQFHVVAQESISNPVMPIPAQVFSEDFQTNALKMSTCLGI